MATSVEKISMELGTESTGGRCLDETENCKPDSDGSIYRNPSGRIERILYDREFLLKCFHSPASGQKPFGFPIAHLDCTLGASKVKRLPTAPQPYQPPKRKEEGSKRDRDGEDNISLRPHSGNFSGGCGPNLTSPSHVSLGNVFSRSHVHEESSKGYDRDYHRNNFRYGSHRRDMNDRNRGDRDRDMDRDRDRDRDHRDRMNRERLSGSNHGHRGSSSWANEGSDDWSRRRNGAHFPRDRDYNLNSNRRYSNDRDRGPRDDEQEPEWFSGGPSSQHETIELRGFLDDDRRDKSDDLRNGYERETSDNNGEGDSSSESTKNDQPPESPMDLSIEKILKMDHISGILSGNENDSLETEEQPSGSSRFSQFFKRNSATPDPGLVRAAHHHDSHDMNSHSNEDKSKAVHEMGELLRSMLIKKSAPSEPAAEARGKDAAKPPPATKDDVDAFKKLVTPLFEKVLKGPTTTQKLPMGGGNMEHGVPQSSPNSNVMDIFKQPPMQKSQSIPIPDDGSRSNPLQDIFNNMMNKQSMPMPAEIVPRMTPNQILQTIPIEMQPLVLNMNVTHSDGLMLMNIAKNNEWTFRSVLNQFLLQQCPPQQHMIYAGLLKLIITGAATLPGVVVQSPISHVMPPMSQPMPNHRAPNFVEKPMPRPVDESPKELTKRSGTPVSSIAFTPTSVMRKMTADGNKSAPPPNPTGFVPVPISGGLLPTPPTTAPVMMNSNNPNLASLMSAMARAPPPPHMQFRPPPIGYPQNPGFHPSMMPPNMHGPVMLPPPFTNMLPNQPVYNKSDDN